LGAAVFWLLVVVVVDVSVLAGACGAADMDESVPAADEAAGALLASAGVVVLVVLVVVSDDAAVVEDSGVFWQAPSPKARPTARVTAKAVRWVMGFPSANSL
jgi:hypothetical protein